MSRPAWLETTAVVAAATILAAACSHGSDRGAPKPNPTTTSKPAATPTRAVTVHAPIVTRGPAGKSRGATATIEVRIRPSADRRLHVVFDPTDVGTTRVQWEAAGWGAVAAATLLTHAPLRNREIAFHVTGPLDGTSAGALMTVAVIALIRGDHIVPGVTMTGVINPDGSIGPVLGLPYKVDGAVAAHQTRMLVPTGQRESRNDAGKIVDVVAKGQRRGLEVVDTPTVYDAYRELTGKSLPQPSAATSTRLDAGAYEKIQAGVESWRSKYDSAVSDFHSLAPGTQQDLQSYATAARQDARESQTLSEQGLHAGAFAKAVDAAAFMSAIAHVGQAFPTLLGQGVGPFVAQIKASASLPDEIADLVATLKTITPRTVGDADALLAAYGNAIDAVGLERTAQRLFAERPANPDDARARAAQGAVYYELAHSLVDAATDRFLVGQELGGAALGADVDETDVAHFFRRAAEANLDAFRAVVIAPVARPQKVSVALASAALAQTDSAYALARTGDAVLQSLPPYFGTGRAAESAQLGGAMNLYVRSAALMAKYSSYGRLRPATFALTGISNSEAFNSAVQFAQSQLSANIGFLLANHVNPITAATENELATVDQNGDASRQFDALADYWNGYLNSRVLAYFGGFAE